MIPSIVKKQQPQNVRFNYQKQKQKRSLQFTLFFGILQQVLRK